ncbi:hypothetical protein Y886_20770 [Xanthomonas hyacinthi DSM 19077]|nr:hypothetical protein Y886_20770 [Xanthomonas hyacinthi DSM 19077]
MFDTLVRVAWELKIFNRVLLEMLLGGIYTEAAAPGHIFRGILYKTGYVRMYAQSGQVASLHSALRDRSASTTESIRLLDLKPHTISDLEKAVARGRKIVNKCNLLSHEVVLAGCSHFVSGALAEVLFARHWGILVFKASGDCCQFRYGWRLSFRASPIRTPQGSLH